MSDEHEKRRAKLDSLRRKLLLGDDSDDFMPVFNERIKRGNRKVGCTHKNDPHALLLVASEFLPTLKIAAAF